MSRTSASVKLNAGWIAVLLAQLTTAANNAAAASNVTN
jgi:hypothetical protein